MTLVEALAICQERAKDMTLSDCERQWYARLSDWLRELKYHQEMEKCRIGRVFASPSTNY